jgi:hypothetical protein
MTNWIGRPRTPPWAFAHGGVKLIHFGGLKLIHPMVS